MANNVQANTEPTNHTKARVKSRTKSQGAPTEDGEVNVTFNRKTIAETRKWIQEARLMWKVVRMFFGLGKRERARNPKQKAA